MKKTLFGTSVGLLPILAMPVFAPTVSAQDARQYKVVINHEEQYSIWFADRENPLGWNDVGKTGALEDCRAYIEEVWTDMRPLSLRQQMEKRGLDKDKARYQVVINHEEQYSIWMVDRDVPENWQATDKTCALQECMSYIEEVWTDMRPLSLRRKMEKDGQP